jgi:hypothetical protein
VESREEQIMRLFKVSFCPLQSHKNLAIPILKGVKDMVTVVRNSKREALKAAKKIVAVGYKVRAIGFKIMR